MASRATAASRATVASRATAAGRTMSARRAQQQVGRWQQVGCGHDHEEREAVSGFRNTGGSRRQRVTPGGGGQGAGYGKTAEAEYGRQQTAEAEAYGRWFMAGELRQADYGGMAEGGWKTAVW